jgi:hypothetical protein
MTLASSWATTHFLLAATPVEVSLKNLIQRTHLKILLSPCLGRGPASAIVEDGESHMLSPFSPMQSKSSAWKRRAFLSLNST